MDQFLHSLIDFSIHFFSFIAWKLYWNTSLFFQQNSKCSSASSIFVRGNWYEFSTQRSTFRCQFHQHLMRGVFVRKFWTKLFFYLDSRFILFWRKNIGAKAARNMLVKLTFRSENHRQSSQDLRSTSNTDKQIRKTNSSRLRTFHSEFWIHQWKNYGNLDYCIA